VRGSANRRRFLLVLLLALLAVAGATAPAAAHENAARYQSAAPGTPATHHDLRDWLRLPVAARHALSTPLPDSWWAVSAQTSGTGALPGRSIARVATGTAVATAVTTTRSTRAPPARVS
jgi:hypothetical protein